MTDRSFLRKVLIALLLVAAAMACRRIGLAGRLRLALGYLRSFIYIGLFAAWGISVRRRVMQVQARRYLGAIAALMVFWIVVRTAKYFLLTDPDVIRLSWYSYYLPMLFIPLLAVSISLSMGKPEDFRLKPWSALFYLPTAAMVLLVLTNDLHQSVFVFPPGAPVWTDHAYGYGAGYWLVMGWAAVCGLTAIVVMLFKCRVPRSRTVLWLPIVPMILAAAYAVAIVCRVRAVCFVMGDVTVSLCLFFMAFFECCIQCGLILSNTHYDELFRIAGIHAIITDRNYDLLLSSADDKETPPVEVMRKTEAAPVLLDGDIRLCGAPIRRGHVIWTEDVSEVCRLLSRLGEVNERLSEDNDLLEAENELKKRRAQVAEKDRLYDKVTKAVLPQFQALDELFSVKADLPVREKMRRLCVCGTYIKRRSNLLILREDEDACPAKELEYCLRESLEALSSAGVNSSFRRKCDGEIRTLTAVQVYDLMEELVEAMLPSLSALFLNMTIHNGCTDLKLLADHSESLPAEFPTAALLTEQGGTWSLAHDGGTTTAVLHLARGGEGT